MFTKIFIALFAATAVLSAPVESAEKRITHTGRATFYSPSVGIGACGWQNTDEELVVALNAPQYALNADHNCGQSVRITNEQNGNQEIAKVVDLCPGCNDGDLDMSPALFGALNNNDFDQGVFPISWNFLSRDDTSSSN
ncbi:hypothetical protein J008_06562 [Cryptococcus neoformans]|nr:hypothetical protein C362_06539 [Cryptococcus neoformans var. grubii Bt1]OXG11611.1 hypothetical protein C367_06535 [Cryptococcus neoformans var. grubii Ze90-1]OXH22159.1 hypothetical protein J008_06562 [Cryptococcus neoformans var. grubii]